MRRRCWPLNPWGLPVASRAPLLLVEFAAAAEVQQALNQLELQTSGQGFTRLN